MEILKKIHLYSFNNFKNEIVRKLYRKGDTGNLSKLCLAKIIWSENQREGVDWMMDLFGLMKYMGHVTKLAKSSLIRVILKIFELNLLLHYQTGPKLDLSNIELLNIKCYKNIS